MVIQLQQELGSAQRLWPRNHYATDLSAGWYVLEDAAGNQSVLCG